VNVLQIMNYGAAYKGNFMSAMLLLDEALKARSGTVVYLLPERAKERGWANDMICEGEPVYFMPGNLLRAALLIKKLIKAHGIDLVHAHFIDFRQYLPLRAALLFTRVPHLFHAHSLPKKRSGAPVNFLRRKLIGAKKVLCVSGAVREQYAARGYDCVTVKNGLDFARLDDFQPLSRGALTKYPGAKTVFMMGYDVQIKGVDTAVRALRDFDTARRFALCVCVANHLDEVTAQIAALLDGGIPDWVTLLPPRPDIAAYYRAADVFLSASRFEGLPYSVCEAAYSGLPLALSDIPPHRELSIPGVVFFEPDDAQGLYDALCALPNAPPPSAREYVAGEFAIDTWIAQILAIYDKASL